MAQSNNISFYNQNEWSIERERVIVMHDKPPPFFRKCSLEEKHDLFLRIHELVSPRATKPREHVEETIVTVRSSDGKVTSKNKMPVPSLDCVFSIRLPLGASALPYWCPQRGNVINLPSSHIIVTSRLSAGQQMKTSACYSTR